MPPVPREAGPDDLRSIRNQFSQYRSKPIPSTVREATYVLDGILDNETELPIAEHTSDTAGYTDLVFSLFNLLGFAVLSPPARLGRPEALPVRHQQKCRGRRA
jgi:TnpA family transposase